ncbi:hypothetical protein [Nocardia huaxiensis]|uniref:hypothetical protein n=1 Tax=Nocardia huaxiensis TaxID=2755382 RepID=UPI003B82CCDE
MGVAVAAAMEVIPASPVSRHVERRVPGVSAEGRERRWIRLVPAGYSLVLALLVVGPLLGPGYLLLRDAVSTPRSYLTDSALGLGDAAPRAVPQDALIAVLSTVIDGGLIVKTILVVAIWLAGWGAAVLARELLHVSTAPQLVASTVAIWNPYIAERLLQGHWSLLTGYASLPWIALLANRLRTTDRPFPTWAALTGCLAAAGLTPTGSLLAGCVAALLVGFRKLPGVVAIWLATSAPWLVATALSGAASAPSDPAGVAAFAARAEPGLGTLGSLAGLGGIWNSTAVPGTRTTLFALIGTIILLGLVATGLRAVLGHPVDRAKTGGASTTRPSGDSNPPPNTAAAFSSFRRAFGRNPHDLMRHYSGGSRPKPCRDDGGRAERRRSTDREAAASADSGAHGLPRRTVQGGDFTASAHSPADHDARGVIPGGRGAGSTGGGGRIAESAARHTRRVLLGVAAVAIVVAAAGATGWGLSIGEWLVAHVPGAGLLRDTQKYVALAMPAFALCAAAGCGVIAARIRSAATLEADAADAVDAERTGAGRVPGTDCSALDRSGDNGDADAVRMRAEDGPRNGFGDADRETLSGAAASVMVTHSVAGQPAYRGRTAGVAAVFIALLFVSLPDLAWGVGGQVRAVEYPAGWERVAGMVEGPGDVAVLPGGMFRKFRWAGDAPVLDPAPRILPRDVLQTGELPVRGGSVAGEGNRAREVEQLLLHGGSAAELGRLGVGWVLAEKGTPGPVGDSKSTLGQLNSVYSDSSLELYRVPGEITGHDASASARRIAGAAHLLWGALLFGGLLVAAGAGRVTPSGIPRGIRTR